MSEKSEITNEQVARWLGWTQHVNGPERYWRCPSKLLWSWLPDWRNTLELCIRDVIYSLIKGLPYHDQCIPLPKDWGKV